MKQHKEKNKKMWKKQKEIREKPKKLCIRKTNNEEIKGGEEKHEVGGNENIVKLLSVPRVVQQVFSTQKN